MAMAVSIQAGCVLKSGELISRNGAGSSFRPASACFNSEMFGTKLRAKQVALARPSRPTRRNLRVSALFGLGVPELVVIAGVAALVFGPKKLPEIGKSLGKTVKSFQQAANEFQAELTPPQGEADKSEQSEDQPETETPASAKPENPNPSVKIKENAEI